MSLLCPKCHNVMNAYERNGVTVDQCVECKGLFLDRGELEHLARAEATFYGDAPAPVPAAPYGGGDRGFRDERARTVEGRRDHRDGYRDEKYYERKKRKSFLEDLLDL